MATGDVKVTEGSGKNIATFTITEDTETKQVQRVALTDSGANEIMTAAQVTSLLSKLDTLHSDLGTLNTDIGSSNTDLATLHIDVGTTLHADIGSTNTKLDTLHADLTGTLAVSNSALTKFGTGYYVTVAASATATVLQSSSGASGDYIDGILVIPASTSPGNVLLLDNATSITVFAGGANSVSNLVPFFIPLGAVSRSGAWKLTTGANVSCVAIGKFS